MPNLTIDIKKTEATFEKSQAYNIPTTTTRDLEIQSVTTQMALSMTNTQHSVVRQHSPIDRVMVHRQQPYENPEKVMKAKDIIKDIYSFEYHPDEQSHKISFDKQQRVSPSIVINYTNRVQETSKSPVRDVYKNK